MRDLFKSKTKRGIILVLIIARDCYTDNKKYRGVINHKIKLKIRDKF